jgi:LysM repeat protein
MNITRDWQDEDGLTEEHMCSDYYLGLLELDLRSPSTSHVIQAGSSASDVLSLISRCSNGGYKPFVPTSMALNTTTDTTMQPTTVCEPSAIYTIQPGDTCKDLCLAHNVSTHSLTASNGLEAYCRDFPLAGTEICLPKSCNVYTVNINDTMQSIAEQQPGNVSIAQLLAWNPILIPLWKLIRQTHLQICVSPPMSALSVPNAANIKCGRYYTIRPGDTCADITTKGGISLPNLDSLNSDIKTDCANLVVGERYCVLPVVDIKE